MKTFNDTKGREWQVAINVATVKRVRDLLELDLLEIAPAEDESATPPLFLRLAEDPILFADVLYVLCKPECDGRNVSDEDFGAALGGDVIGAATDALLAEIVNFFHGSKRQTLAKALAMTNKLRARRDTLVMERMDSPQMEKQLDELLSATLPPICGS